MDQRLKLKHHLIALALVAAWCVLMAISFTTGRYESALFRGMEVGWSDVLIPYLLSNGSCICLTPFMLFICHRFRFDRGRLLRTAGVHVLSGVLFSIIDSFVTWALFKKFVDYDVPMFGIGSTLFGCLNYFTFLAVYSGIMFYHRFRERETRASRLASQLARANLQVLKMQLHPHFLFNTLHSISSLNHHDVKAANRMISRLSDLLRISLDNIGLHEVPLQKEIEFLKLYLDIEMIRFKGRLDVRMDISPEATAAFVPNMILQPIVENAVKHGIDRIGSKGEIVLRAQRKENLLHIDIQDNGPGISVDENRRASGVGLAPSVGLTNTEARLNSMYGRDATLEVDSPAGGGCVARLVIPFHTEPNEDFLEQPA